MEEIDKVERSIVSPAPFPITPISVEFDIGETRAFQPRVHAWKDPCSGDALSF